MSSAIASSLLTGSIRSPEGYNAYRAFRGLADNDLAPWLLVSRRISPKTSELEIVIGRMHFAVGNLA